MRIIGVTVVEYFIVETSEKDYNIYRKKVGGDKDSWEVLMGDSWESLYDDGRELEEKFIKYQASKE